MDPLPQGRRWRDGNVTKNAALHACKRGQRRNERDKIYRKRVRCLLSDVQGRWGGDAGLASLNLFFTTGPAPAQLWFSGPSHLCAPTPCCCCYYCCCCRRSPCHCFRVAAATLRARAPAADTVRCSAAPAVLPPAACIQERQWQRQAEHVFGWSGMGDSRQLIRERSREKQITIPQRALKHVLLVCEPHLNSPSAPSRSAPTHSTPGWLEGRARR